MLKSPVLAYLIGGCLLFTSLSAGAYPGRSVGPVSPGAAEMLTASNAHFALAYVVPGRRVQKFVTAYIRNNDEELAEVRGRSSQPFTIIDSVMEHYDLPVELRYLAVIESELRATALSRVGAKGPWQLMARTARDLGLKVGRRADERTNYYKSTKAAALYLRDLHREFKDWLLVLAAYNAGPVPVHRAMRLAGSRNFWALERYLPGETRGHIRRFIATAYYFAMCQPVSEPVRADSAMARSGAVRDGVGGECGGICGAMGGVAGDFGMMGVGMGGPHGMSGSGFGAFAAVGDDGFGSTVSRGFWVAGTAWRRVGALM